MLPNPPAMLPSEPADDARVGAARHCPHGECGLSRAAGGVPSARAFGPTTNGGLAGSPRTQCVCGRCELNLREPCTSVNLPRKGQAKRVRSYGWLAMYLLAGATKDDCMKVMSQKGRVAMCVFHFEAHMLTITDKQVTLNLHSSDTAPSVPLKTVRTRVAAFQAAKVSQGGRVRAALHVTRETPRAAITHTDHTMRCRTGRRSRKDGVTGILPVGMPIHARAQKPFYKHRAGEQRERVAEPADADAVPGGGGGSRTFIRLGARRVEVVYLCVDRDDVDTRLQELGILDAPVLGFDTEARPTRTVHRQFPTHVVQLSTLTHCVVSLGSSRLPRKLSRVLRSREVLKIGVGVLCDLNQLCADRPDVLGHKPGAFIDLALLAMFTGHAAACDDPMGLKGLAALFDITIEKKVDVVMSRWDEIPLDAQQISYAAMDASVARWLASKLLACEADDMLAGAARPFANLPCALQRLQACDGEKLQCALGRPSFCNPIGCRTDQARWP